MAPRKPKKVPIGEVIATTIKRQRERQDWTQEQLAEQMNKLGFTSWARTTVTEVEGSGRRRQVSIGELLGLASLFGVGVNELLWDEKLRLELVPGGAIVEERAGLLCTLITPTTLVDLAVGPAVGVFKETMLKEYVRVYGILTERVQALAADLRGSADWFETEALARLNAPTTEEES